MKIITRIILLVTFLRLKMLLKKLKKTVRATHFITLTTVAQGCML